MMTSYLMTRMLLSYITVRLLRSTLNAGPGKTRVPWSGVFGTNDSLSADS